MTKCEIARSLIFQIVMVQNDVLDILLLYNPYPFPYVLVAKFAIVVKVEPFPYVLVAKFAIVAEVKSFQV